MKLVKVQIELVIDDNSCGQNHEDVANFLNRMLYTDPEFFGEFGKENISSIVDFA